MYRFLRQIVTATQAKIVPLISIPYAVGLIQDFVYLMLSSFQSITEIS
jgi:hypothetical protein